MKYPKIIVEVVMALPIHKECVATRVMTFERRIEEQGGGSLTPIALNRSLTDSPFHIPTLLTLTIIIDYDSFVPIDYFMFSVFVKASCKN